MRGKTKKRIDALEERVLALEEAAAAFTRDSRDIHFALSESVSDLTDKVCEIAERFEAVEGELTEERKEELKAERLFLEGLSAITNYKG